MCQPVNAGAKTTTMSGRPREGEVVLRLAVSVSCSAELGNGYLLLRIQANHGVGPTGRVQRNGVKCRMRGCVQGSRCSKTKGSSLVR